MRRLLLRPVPGLGLGDIHSVNAKERTLVLELWLPKPIITKTCWFDYQRIGGKTPTCKIGEGSPPFPRTYLHMVMKWIAYMTMGEQDFKANVMVGGTILTVRLAGFSSRTKWPVPNGQGSCMTTNALQALGSISTETLPSPTPRFLTSAS
jgi:hypothetical protein